MYLNLKTRRVLAGAVVGAALLSLAAGAQIDTSNGVTVTPDAARQAQALPPAPLGPGLETGIGGSGRGDGSGAPGASTGLDGGVRDAGG